MVNWRKGLCGGEAKKKLKDSVFGNAHPRKVRILIPHRRDFYMLV